MLGNIHLKTDKDERNKHTHDVNYFSDVGYEANLDQSCSEANNQNVVNIQFSDAVEKLFFIIQNELESIGIHIHILYFNRL
jgi:hypothetical protein